ncbi:MAG: hypothetical protein AAGA58_05965 [Verrucomicrobiota bacterium]
MPTDLSHSKFDRLPGIEIARKGLEDLKLGKESAESYLIMIGAPRLRHCGIDIPLFTPPKPSAEICLYRHLLASGTEDPYSNYNSLLRRFVSFESSLERIHAAAVTA